jgi:hypothetical protein
MRGFQVCADFTEGNKKAAESWFFDIRGIREIRG